MKPRYHLFTMLLGSVILLVVNGAPAWAHTGTALVSVAPAPAAPVPVGPTPAPLPHVTKKPKVVITLDFADPAKGFTYDGDPDNMKKGDSYLVKLIHINRLNYKAIIVGKDTIKSAELKMPSYSTFGLSDLVTLSNVLTSLGGKNAQPTVSPSVMTFSMMVVPLKIIGPTTQDQTIENLIDAYSSNLINYTSVLIAQTNDITTLLADANQRVWESKLDAIPATTPTSATLASFQASVNTTQSKLNTLESDMAEKNKQYLSDIKDYKDYIKIHPALAENDTRVQAAYQKITEAIAKAKAAVAADVIKTLTDALVAAINNADRSYTSLPQQFSKDQTTIKISVVPQTGTSGTQSYTTSLKFPLSSRLFFGVSSGFFLSGLHNDAYSTSASTPTTSTATTSTTTTTTTPTATTATTVTTATTTTNPTYNIVQEQPGSYEFGVNALARVGYVFNPNDKMPVGIQLGFGPGLAVTNKVRPRVMLGGGLSFGSNQRILLDYGINFGYVDRLSQVYEGYSTSKPYTGQPTDITVSVIKHSWYVGIHYLFISF